MRRDPTIHVKLSALSSILVEIPYDNRMPPQKLAELILERAQPYQLKNRYMISAGTDKARKKLQKAVDSTNPIVEKFNRMLMEERLKAGHRGIKLVDKNHKDYLLLKEVSKIAYDFCESAEVSPKDDGYREFIKLGLKMMNKKYALNKFKYYAERIIQTFEDMAVVLGDDSVEDTDYVASVYSEKVGIEFDRRDYDKFVNFVYARMEADEEDAYYDDWVLAQFDGLAFLGDVAPELSQLHGDKALDRYRKYMSKQKEDPEESRMSEEEKEYFDKLKK